MRGAWALLWTLALPGGCIRATAPETPDEPTAEAEPAEAEDPVGSCAPYPLLDPLNDEMIEAVRSVLVSRPGTWPETYLDRLDQEIQQRTANLQASWDRTCGMDAGARGEAQRCLTARADDGVGLLRTVTEVPSGVEAIDGVPALLSAFLADATVCIEATQIEARTADLPSERLRVARQQVSTARGLLELGRDERARSLMKRIADRLEGMHDPRLLSEFYALQSSMAVHDNDVPTAIARAETAVEVATPTGGTSLARAQLSMAVAQVVAGELEDALATIKSAEAEGGSSPAITGELYALRGLALRMKADEDGARAAFDRAVLLYERAVGEDDPHVAQVLVWRARGKARARDHTSATRDWARAREIYSASFGADHPATSEAGLGLAAAYAETGQTAALASLCAEIRPFVERHPDRSKRVALEVCD